MRSLAIAILIAATAPASCTRSDDPPAMLQEGDYLPQYQWAIEGHP